jgi:hypothetical protein
MEMTEVERLKAVIQKMVDMVNGPDDCPPGVVHNFAAFALDVAPALLAELEKKDKMNRWLAELTDRCPPGLNYKQAGCLRCEDDSMSLCVPCLLKGAERAASAPPKPMITLEEICAVTSTLSNGSIQDTVNAGLLYEDFKAALDEFMEKKYGKGGGQ